MKSSNLNEKKIQKALWNYFDGLQHQLIAPNIHLHRSEADFITVTKSGYVNEIEIKVTKADFKNDFKHKKHKHRIMESLNRDALAYQALTVYSPNYFWFAIPKTLYPKCDFHIPDCYGIITIDEPLNFVTVVKRAKILHREKITDRQLKRIARSLMYKYWTKIR